VGRKTLAEESDAFDAFIAKYSRGVQGVLEETGATTREAAPAATETTTYLRRYKTTGRSSRTTTQRKLS